MSAQDYLSAEEIAAHESAIQAIRSRDKRAAAEQSTSMKDEIEWLIVEQEKRVVLRRIYHEAPNDIMELIVFKSSDVGETGWGMGGMNVLRLVSKRLMRVVESCATRLTNHLTWNGPNSFPFFLRRCKRIERITCHSHNLWRSLEGCPNGLKSLTMLGESLESLDARHISDLSPLASCTKIKKLIIKYSQVSDLSPLSSMPLLEDLVIYECSGIKSLHLLSGLMNLRKLDRCGIDPETSLMPLTLCTGLKELWCSRNAVDLEELRKMLPGLRKMLPGLMVATED